MKRYWEADPDISHPWEMCYQISRLDPENASYHTFDFRNGQWVYEGFDSGYTHDYPACLRPTTRQLLENQREIKKLSRGA